MPHLDAHEEAAIRNQTVLDCLLENDDHFPDAFAPWIVTVAFYKALHLVEGILFVDGAFHSKDHQERNQRLKTSRKFAHLWKHYRPLWEASMVARYLFDPSSNTDQPHWKVYLSGDSVRSTFINHHLRQIEKSFDEKKMDDEEK